MYRRTIVLAGAAFLSARTTLEACGSRRKTHTRVEGDIAALGESELHLTVNDRSTTVLLTGKTKVVRSGSVLDASVLKVGDRIVVLGERVAPAEISAAEIRLGERTAAPDVRKRISPSGHQH